MPEIRERASDGKCAWLIQGSAQAVYRLTYSWALRGSYQVIYIDNVALAPENINSVPPGFTLANAVRPVRVNNDGEVLYTGFTIAGNILGKFLDNESIHDLYFLSFVGSERRILYEGAALRLLSSFSSTIVSNPQKSASLVGSVLSIHSIAQIVVAQSTSSK